MLVNPPALRRRLLPQSNPHPRLEALLARGAQFALDVVMGINGEAVSALPSDLGMVSELPSGLLDPGVVGITNVSQSCFAAAAYQALLSIRPISRMLADDHCSLPLRQQLHALKRPLPPVQRTLALLSVAKGTWSLDRRTFTDLRHAHRIHNWRARRCRRAAEQLALYSSS